MTIYCKPISRPKSHRDFKIYKLYYICLFDFLLMGRNLMVPLMSIYQVCCICFVFELLTG